MAEKKESILATLKVLDKFSDEDHPLSAMQIQQYLKEEFGVEIERRTIYSNLDLLRTYEYEINTYQENHQGYYLMNRMFEESEIILLANAIHASKSVSPSQSRDLIKRLLLTQGEYYFRSRRDLYWSDSHKLKDNEFFYRIEMINRAIFNHVCIELDYMHFNLDKELVQRRSDKYILHPYKIVYSDEKSYLVAKSDNHLEEFEFSNYRIDKIRNCRMLTQKTNYLTLKEEEMLKQYSQDRPYMFSGEFIRATFRCSYSILDPVIDTFGNSVILSEESDKTFRATVNATEKEILIFAFQYARDIELLEPESIRENYVKELDELRKRYL